MPRGDGTGPAGMGPMTGRGAGYCAGYPVPGFMNPVGGRGYWGWGRGRGGLRCTVCSSTDTGERACRPETTGRIFTGFPR